MSRHYEILTQEKLARKILEAYNQHEYTEEDNKVDLSGDLIKKVEGSGGYYMKTLTPKIQSDLSKVDFDFENCDTSRDYSSYEGLMGIRTLSNGMTYLGCAAGGDWEYPVFFIIYWNGVSLRAYIPKHGNVYNYDTKTAIGNDEEADKKFLMKQLKSSYKTESWADNMTNAPLLKSPLWIDIDIQKRIIRANS